MAECCQCVAVCRSLLQCVAVSCSVLQCVDLLLFVCLFVFSCGVETPTCIVSLGFPISLRWILILSISVTMMDKLDTISVLSVIIKDKHDTISTISLNTMDTLGTISIVSVNIMDKLDMLV